jgi:hypothetical protein
LQSAPSKEKKASGKSPQKRRVTGPDETWNDVLNTTKLVKTSKVSTQNEIKMTLCKFTDDMSIFRSSLEAAVTLSSLTGGSRVKVMS